MIHKEAKAEAVVPPFNERFSKLVGTWKKEKEKFAKRVNALRLSEENNTGSTLKVALEAEDAYWSKYIIKAEKSAEEFLKDHAEEEPDSMYPYNSFKSSFVTALNSLADCFVTVLGQPTIPDKFKHRKDIGSPFLNVHEEHRAARIASAHTFPNKNFRSHSMHKMNYADRIKKIAMHYKRANEAHDLEMLEKVSDAFKKLVSLMDTAEKTRKLKIAIEDGLTDSNGELPDEFEDSLYFTKEHIMNNAEYLEYDLKRKDYDAAFKMLHNVVGMIGVRKNEWVNKWKDPNHPGTFIKRVFTEFKDAYDELDASAREAIYWKTKHPYDDTRQMMG